MPGRSARHVGRRCGSPATESRFGGAVPCGCRRDNLSSTALRSRIRMVVSRGALAIAEGRRRAPHFRRRRRLLALAGLAGVGGAHVDATGNAVDLRNPQAVPLHERSLEARAGDVLLDAGHGLRGNRAGPAEVETGFHPGFFLASTNDVRCERTGRGGTLRRTVADRAELTRGHGDPPAHSRKQRRAGRTRRAPTRSRARRRRVRRRPRT